MTPPPGWGTATSSSYDAAGRLTGLATANATFAYTSNRAGHRLSEAATVAGDPQNGTATFAYDPLGRLVDYVLPGIRTLAATWQADPNRAGLSTDGTPVATTFDAADRPTSTGFATDLDGRLTAIPARGGAAAKSLAYDALGRLVSATVGGVTRTYTYDPLDRLVTVSEGGSAVVRFRYVGQTASVAQLLDGAWAVTRNIGTDATGTSLADWAAGGSGWRRYLLNGHGDLVATAAANGTISASLRLDPWGVPLRAVPAGYPAFGFQGSLTDRTTTLVYARARWYDPVLATFTSEDALAGDPADPPSRHGYAYGAGDPVDRVDPDGLFWYRVPRDTTWGALASGRLGASARWPMIWNANKNRYRSEPRQGGLLRVGSCLYVPVEWLVRPADRARFAQPGNAACSGLTWLRLPKSVSTADLRTAQSVARIGESGGLFSFTRSGLHSLTDAVTRRPRIPTIDEWRRIGVRVDDFNRAAKSRIAGLRVSEWINDVWVVPTGGAPWYCFRNPCTAGQYVFLQGRSRSQSLLAHEYIHVLQYEGRGWGFHGGYFADFVGCLGCSGAGNASEAPGYLWEFWIESFGAWESPPWHIWRRPPGGLNYRPEPR